MLSLIHKTTVALLFSVYLSVRMKAALRSPLFKINSKISFPFLQDVTKKKKKTFSNCPSPADIMPFNHACGFLLQKAIKTKIWLKYRYFKQLKLSTVLCLRHDVNY